LGFCGSGSASNFGFGRSFSETSLPTVRATVPRRGFFGWPQNLRFVGIGLLIAGTGYALEIIGLLRDRRPAAGA
jgi:hypothetical protein